MTSVRMDNLLYPKISCQTEYLNDELFRECYLLLMYTTSKKRHNTTVARPFKSLNRLINVIHRFIDFIDLNFWERIVLPLTIVPL